MRPLKALQTYREQIRSVVLAHRATNACVFGSVVRDEANDEVSFLDNEFVQDTVIRNLET